jgi:hypothetical protein
MEKVGRRSFLQLVGGAAAAGVALAKVEAAPVVLRNQAGDIITGRRDEVPAPATSLHADPEGRAVAEGVETVTPWYGDRLQLLQQRGLLAPCPNCGRVVWGTARFEMLACAGCGWESSPRKVYQRCACSDCAWDAGGRSMVNAFPRFRTDDEGTTDLRTLQSTAAPGFYLLTHPDGAPILTYELNSYDIDTDDVVHHAAFQQVGRVICAVRALGMEDTFSGYDQARRMDGNLVLLHRKMIDCYEWKQRRGERPEFTYLREPDGSTRLVQGVTRA